MENHRDILCLYLTPRPHGIDPPAPMWYTIIVQFGPLPRYEKKSIDHSKRGKFINSIRNIKYSVWRQKNTLVF